MNSPQRTTGKQFRTAFFITVILGALVIGFLDRHWTVKSRNCRICASKYEHRTTFVFGIPVAAWDTDVRPTPDTIHYFEPYLGYAHGHEWTGGGYSRYGSGGIGCGKSSYGPYPQHQRYLTTMGFRLVAASGIEDPAERRAYFESIIKNEDMGHFLRIRKTHDPIAEQISNNPAAGRYRYRAWAPDMEGIEVPEYVREGGLFPE